MKWSGGAAVIGIALAFSTSALSSRAVLDSIATQSDLDDFMGQVLVRRDENWKKLQQYVLDERERIEVRGPTGLPIWGDGRTYMWYIRDGFFVRSPVTVSGVGISDQDRRRYEDEFLKRARQREKRDQEQAATNQASRTESGATGNEGAAGVDSSEGRDASREFGGLLAQTRQPQFIDTAYFLRFKFEPGKYALVGREVLNGEEVLRIEYYPARLFSHEQDTQEKRRAEGRSDRREDVEATMERLMNKVSLVTLWVTPSTRQIVKYTFDNVNFDFLPAAWLVRVSEMKATMTMSQPFKDVWLPRDVDMRFGAMLAIGPIDLRYRLDYVNYREATTGGRLVPNSVR